MEYCHVAFFIPFFLNHGESFALFKFLGRRDSALSSYSLEIVEEGGLFVMSIFLAKIDWE